MNYSLLQIKYNPSNIFNGITKYYSFHYLPLHKSEDLRTSISQYNSISVVIFKNGSDIPEGGYDTSLKYLYFHGSLTGFPRKPSICTSPHQYEFLNFRLHKKGQGFDELGVIRR